MLQVTDTRSHTLYQRERFTETSGKFAFTADEYDIFEICFSTHLPPSLLPFRKLYDKKFEVVKNGC